jgi:alanyl-tRNA synthetase
VKSDEIRQRFLDFFKDHDHRVVRSSSLVPAGDPTLLFTNAGMNQFKDVFLGREKRDYLRATTCQKCVRAGGKHNDLEQVGRTTRHHTFFEMLGNFSFGDYFKEEAIPFAWQLITSGAEGYGLPADKLYATIFEGFGDIPRDAEAYDCWRSVGVPAERIFELGMKDNFWQMGDTGPCGPCSEVHYDMGPAASDLGHADCKFPCDCGRYVELWNLVFMQFNRDETGTMTPLPRPSIDTGAGLERISAVLQGKLSNFETDLFWPLIDYVQRSLRDDSRHPCLYAYGDTLATDVSLRIIADHARAATFLLSDGVFPDKGDRGFVLRRIIKRAVRHGRVLGYQDGFFYRMPSVVAELMKGPYPEIVDAVPRIANVIRKEEDRYEARFSKAIERFNNLIPIIVDQQMKLYPTSAPVKLTQGSDGSWTVAGEMLFQIPGNVAFELYGTYGLTLEELQDEATLRGNLWVGPATRHGFDQEMELERERARASWKGAEKKAASPDYLALAEKYKTEFFGYRETETRDSRILGLMVKGAPVNEVARGAEMEIILDRTPFYAEAGGQIGDTGYFTAPGSPEHVAEIKDTYRPVSGITAHKAIARETLHLGDLVTARIDAERRDAIMRNHTATHLLHAALRKVLGTHVKQAGSLVAPDHLRFDFSHYASVDRQDLSDIEDLVNEHTLENEEIHEQWMGIEEALASGAMALFGEKYCDRVRVVTVGDGSFSKELCGGTHVERTGEIGLFKVTSEGSVSAGARRVEALTGTGLLQDLRRRMALLHEIEARLKTKPDDLLATLEKLEESEKQARKELQTRAAREASLQAAGLLANAREVDGIKLITARVEAGGADVRATMRQMVDDLRPRLGSGVVLLASVADGKVAVLAAVSKDLTARLDAGKIMRAAAALVDGSGGGRKDLAEAGGKSPEKLQAMLDAAPGIVREMLGSG